MTLSATSDHGINQYDGTGSPFAGPIRAPLSGPSRSQRVAESEEHVRAEEYDCA
jgi:hypothetical protein